MKRSAGLAYREEGPEDGRAVLLVHGFPETSYMWRDAANAWPPAAAKWPHGSSQCSSPRRIGWPGLGSGVERLRACTQTTVVAMPASIAMTAFWIIAIGVAPPRARSVA